MGYSGVNIKLQSFSTYNKNMIVHSSLTLHHNKKEIRTFETRLRVLKEKCVKGKIQALLQPLPWTYRTCFENPVSTWTPEVCKIMAFMAVILGLGLLFYNFWGLGTHDSIICKDANRSCWDECGVHVRGYFPTLWNDPRVGPM